MGLKVPPITVIRSAYELYIQIEFIFNDKSKITSRALSYYSTWLYEEIDFINNELEKKEPLLATELMKRKKNFNAKVLNEHFNEYQKEIMKTKKTQKIKYIPKWYSLFNGPKNISQLSKETSLGRMVSFYIMVCQLKHMA